MTNLTTAVTYAYTNMTEERPTLMDQFNVCREYATERGYTVVGEFNDIDEADHRATKDAVNALYQAIIDEGATVVLIYQPSSWARKRLSEVDAMIEEVTIPPSALERHDSRT